MSRDAIEHGNANVAALLWRTAARAPEAAALIERDARVDYAALRARAAAVARALLDAGVARDDRVAILLERGAGAAAALFGAWAAGAIAVVLHDTLRPRQIEHALMHSGARHLVTTAERLARQPRALQVPVTVLDPATIPPAADAAPAPARRIGSDPAQIIYTSGSTGLPKGVTVTHGNLRAVTEAVCGYLDLRADDRIAALLPFSFVYGLGQLLCAVATGATLVVERSPLPHQVVETLRAARATVLAAVPPLWLRLLAVPGFRDAPLPALRVLTNAGGHLPPVTVRALREAQPEARLYLMYGLTEAIRCTYLPPEELERRPDSIGRAIPGGEVLVVRDDGAPAAPGETGELVFRGPTVTLGYWRDAELTARVFRPHPFRPDGAPDAERVVYTGDLVRRDAEGFLYFVGRRDGIIKTLGYRVGPDEVGDVLLESGEVAEVAVVGEPDEARGQRIVAHVVLAAGGTLERLRRFAERELPSHLHPARFAVHAELPRLASGKHDRAALAAAAPPA